MAGCTQATGAIAAKNNIGTPLLHLNGEPASLVVTAAVNRQRLIAHFPAVAVRAEKHAPAEELSEPGSRWQLVDHARCHEQLASFKELPVNSPQPKHPVDIAGIAHRRLLNDHRWIGAKLRARNRAKALRIHAIVSQKAMHRVRGMVSRPLIVQDQDPPAATTEHKRGVHTRRPRADDDGVPNEIGGG